MGIQSSIFPRKDHAHALSAMGIIVENMDFPLTAQCPYCGEVALNIYENVVATDLWLACTNCSAHGNIITFASEFWKIDVPAAIHKFKNLGVNVRELTAENINAAVKSAKIDTAADRFWKLAADQLWTHGNDLLSLKFRDFGLSPELPCGGLAGVALPDQVAEFCSNLISAYPRKLRTKLPILVLPYCDFPRHYSGFLLIQYQEEFEARRIFLPTQGTRTCYPADAGYYMLEQATLSNHTAVPNALFVVDDPQWVLKAQTVQLRHGDNLLPLCASYSGKELTSTGSHWAALSRRQKFFYSLKITPPLISQTANARGYICALKADGLPKPTQPAKTIKTLGQMYKSAVTWPRALRHILENSNEIAAHSFVSKLVIPSEKMRYFFSNNPIFSPETAESLLSKLAPVYFSSTESTQYSTHIIAKDDGWYTAKNSVITNCLPVIEKIIHTEDDKYYIGHIKKHDKQIPFCEKAKHIETPGLLAYAERLMAAAGEHVIFVPPWNKRSHLTAMALRPPEIIHTRNTPGWDETTKEFYCANFAVNTDGVVRALPHPEINKVKKFDVPEPGLFPPASLQALLTPSPENATTWLTFSAAIANALAPAFNRTPESMAISADIFLPTREALIAAKFEHRELKIMAHRMNQLLANNVKETDWPTLFSVSLGLDYATNMSLVKYPNTAAFIRINPVTTTPALSFGWHVLTGTAQKLSFNYEALPYVAAGYIQHVLKIRAKFATIPSLTKAILLDLNNWLAETYNNTFNLAHAERNFLMPGQETTYLMREINNAILSGDIDVLPAPRKQRQTSNYIVRDNDTWWLNRKVIDRHFHHNSGITPNWMAITDCFSKQGLLRGERTIHKMTGLLVDRDWCDTFWTNYGDTAAKNIG